MVSVRKDRRTELWGRQQHLSSTVSDLPAAGGHQGLETLFINWVLGALCAGGRFYLMSADSLVFPGTFCQISNMSFQKERELVFPGA